MEKAARDYTQSQTQESILTLHNKNISNIAAALEELPVATKRLFDQIFSVTVSEGDLKPPKTMLPFIEQHFGSVDLVRRQKIIKITNRITFEGAIFNSLRAMRPRQFEDRLKVESWVLDKAHDDPLANPLENTPEDPFGRIQGKHSITAGNIAKYDGLHSIIIFDDYNPLAFSREKIVDYLDTGWKWAQKAHEYDPSAKYFFFLWNSLKKAGASLAHGHAQVVLGRDSHYAKVEALHNATLNYQQKHNANYFDDLYHVHHDLGLASEKSGIRMISYLTPIKEKEVLLFTQDFNNTLGAQIYEVLACFRDKLFVTAFNLGCATPPLGNRQGDWSGFPVIARIVDRGYPWDGSSDFGTMELFAASIISSDPFHLAATLKNNALQLERNG